MISGNSFKAIVERPQSRPDPSVVISWQRQASQTLAIALSLVAILLYYYSILRFAVNFPYSDDYTAVLDYLLQFREKSGHSWQQFNMIFAQHNEHRIVVCRLAVLAQYYLLGHVNFYWLTIIGNLGLLLVWCSIYWSIHRKSWFNHWLMVPVSYFLFQFQYIEISFFSMASLEGIWVIGLAALTLAMLANTKHHLFFAGAMLTATICAFNQGNGWFVFPAGFLILWQLPSSRARRIIWAVWAILVLAAYFRGYQAPNHLLGKPNYFSVAYYWQCLLFFFSFMGGGLWLHGGWRVPAGLLVTGLWIWACFFAKKKPDLFITGLGIFLLLSAAVATMGRAAFGFDFSEASRYQVNMAIFDGLVALAVYRAIDSKGKIMSATIFSLFAISLCCLSYLYILRWKLYEEPRVKLLIRQAHEGALPADFHYYWGLPDKTYPKQMLKEASEAGIYRSKNM